MMPSRRPSQESWASQLVSSGESSEQLASPSSLAEVASVPGLCLVLEGSVAALEDAWAAQPRCALASSH